MLSIKQIAYGSMGGAVIAVVSFFGSIARIGYIVDPFLIPFCLLFLKVRFPKSSMFSAIATAAIILLPYKYYMTIFLLVYYIVAKMVWYVGEKLTPIKTSALALVYAISHYGAYAFLFGVIYGYNVKEIVTNFTGFPVTEKFIWLIWLVLIIEPFTYAMALQLALEHIKKYRF